MIFKILWLNFLLFFDRWFILFNSLIFFLLLFLISFNKILILIMTSKSKQDRTWCYIFLFFRWFPSLIIDRFILSNKIWCFLLNIFIFTVDFIYFLISFIKLLITIKIYPFLRIWFRICFSCLYFNIIWRLPYQFMH